jgi:DNA ligase-1
VRYAALAKSFEELEKTSSYLKKNTTIADLLKRTPPRQMEMVVPLLLGSVYPAYVSQETGIGLQQLKKAVATASGYSSSEVDKLMEQVGDLGEVASQLLSKKKQVTLLKSTLSVEKVFENIRRLPEITGSGSVDRKVAAVAELLADSSPPEAKFITRTVLGDLRIGVAEGRLRDAVAKAFDVPADAVERAYMLTTDYGKVARAAAEKGRKGLDGLSLTVGHPVNPMLAQRAESVEEVLKRMNGKAAFETKLDGIRIQAHKEGKKIKLFTRSMENYTKMFPDLEDPLYKVLKPKRVIVDGELVAIDKRTGKPMPFQEVLKRRRKYKIEKAIEQIPVEVYLFDVLLSGRRTMIGEPYTKRRKELEKIVKPGERIMVVDQHVLSKAEEIKDFRSEAVAGGHEGLLAKDLGSPYRAGRREFTWLKLKPTVETLDLAVVGVYAGKGKRAGTFGSYLLAARDPTSGKLCTITKVGSGYTDEQLENLTKMFKPLTIGKKPSELRAEIEPDYWIKPEQVFEVIYEEIQKSPPEKHTSGYGLRFPRFVRLREDMSVEDVDTIDDIEQLYSRQQKSKSGKK